MRFKINEIGDGGLPVNVSVTTEWLASACPDIGARTAADGLTFRGQITPTGDDYLLRGELSGDLEAPCARCLEPALVHVDVPITVTFVPAGIFTTTLRVVVDWTTATVTVASKSCSRCAALFAFQEAIATRPGRASPSVARFPSKNTCVDCATGMRTVVPSSSLTTTALPATDWTIPRALPACPCGGPFPPGVVFAGGGAAIDVAGKTSTRPTTATNHPRLRRELLI